MMRLAVLLSARSSGSQSASASEGLAATAEQLNAQAEALQHAVACFRLHGRGAKRLSGQTFGVMLLARWKNHWV
jgi:hypothetical protein